MVNVPAVLKSISVLLALIALVASGPVHAKATVSEVVNTMSCLSLPETLPFQIKKVWVDDAGVQHYRGFRLVYDVVEEGTFAPLGKRTVLLDSNVDRTSGVGDIHGTSVLELTLWGRTGVFEGRLSGDVIGGNFDAHSRAQGSGDFEKMKLTERWLGHFGGFCFISEETTILDPHG